MSITRRWLAALATAVVAVSLTATPASAHTGRAWNGTWSSSMIAAFPDYFGTPNWSGGFENHSVRQPVRVSRGGSSIKIKISNVYGTSPLHLTGASIGRAGDGAAIRPGSLRTVTFHHRRSAVVAAGRQLSSDVVDLPVAPLERLTVTLYFAGATGPATFHPFALATSYRATGDHLRDRTGDAYTETSQSWYYLSGVEVTGNRRAGTVVAFGDSITDGSFTTPDADNRYPDELAERLQAAGRNLGVVNAGIGGNKVLTDTDGFGERATARFTRDALDQPGVRTVIVLEGINDIGTGATAPQPLTAEALIEGHRTLIRAAHARGVRVMGATILPFAGTVYPGYYTEEGERIRDAVNDWIRTGGEYDAVADLDRAMADPADQDRLNPAYDAGDGLHPNDAGMRAMADAIPLHRL
ncbi:SGNH/GDSL hydrolase family protein [Paractinoplanes rishiriensis]|uniref:SGNH hydrolase n=1 Tax=Paractinoplanes rishiriensis TaxID=1050105 RepID=A0A919K170_9ACTN|nr:SGNH/GDSL hydrolase family protein [Actinoplanes rishiriensis]GIE97529.1 SGNH hydrolase [Actinoplanes rishiriensis]